MTVMGEASSQRTVERSSGSIQPEDDEICIVYARARRREKLSHVHIDAAHGKLYPLDEMLREVEALDLPESGQVGQGAVRVVVLDEARGGLGS